MVFGCSAPARRLCGAGRLQELSDGRVAPASVVSSDVSERPSGGSELQEDARCRGCRPERPLLFTCSEQEVPVRASAYVDNALQPLHQLLSDSAGLVAPSTAHEWLRVVLSECTQR